jgi:hypothetical protein
MPRYQFFVVLEDSLPVWKELSASLPLPDISLWSLASA